MNEMIYYVGGYWRRRPTTRKRPHPHEYSAMHNRLVEEVEFMEQRRLQDELAEAIEQELERM